MRAQRNDPKLPVLQCRITDLEAKIANLASPPPTAGPSLTLFQEQVGHNLFAWLAGTVGAFVAVRLYRTQESQHAEEAS